MNPVEYMESVKERLSTDSIVFKFDVLSEVANLNEGYIRVRANLTNGDWLDFSEFIVQSDMLELITYRYQWLDKDKNPIRRWDNTPHYPDLENFPHHIHEGNAKPTAGTPVNIFDVLDEIASLINK